MGIEPTSQAWEAHVLPLYDTRVRKIMILAKAPTKGKRLPARHLGQFTHALRNICFLDLGRFL